MIEMSGKHDRAQPEKSTNKWPTFPDPPTGTHRGGQILFGVAYLTTAAIYVAFLVNTPNLQNPDTWLPITILFALFALSIRLFPTSFSSSLGPKGHGRSSRALVVATGRRDCRRGLTPSLPTHRASA